MTEQPSNNQRHGPLADVRIVDLSNIIAGPVSATHLSDFGADVVKIEHPAGGDSLRSIGAFHPESADNLTWKTAARNKKSIALDLHDPEAQALVRRLAEYADVVVDGFRPGTLERWGLGWDDLHSLNSRLIMCRVSGFGQSGPWRDRAGFGTLAEAMSGYASMSGYPDSPPTLPPFGLADGVAALAAALSITMCLYEREKSGEGQWIDVNLVEPLMSVIGPQLADWEQLGLITQRTGSRSPWGAAPRGVYPCSDGEWIALSGATQTTVIRLFNAIGRPDLAADQRLQNNTGRQENYELVDAAISEWTSQRTQVEVLEIFESLDVVAGPVYDARGILANEHFKQRQSFVRIEDPELGPLVMPNVVSRLSRTPGKIRSTGPALDAHGKDIETIIQGWKEEASK